MSDTSEARFRVKGVVLGTVVAFVGAMVVGIAISFMMLGDVMTSGSPPDPEAIRAAMEGKWELTAATLLFGALFDALGGFVAAKIGKAQPMKHALWTGIVLFAIGAVFAGLGYAFAQEGMKPPFWQTVLSFVIVIPATLFGGYLAGGGGDAAPSDAETS